MIKCVENGCFTFSEQSVEQRKSLMHCMFKLNISQSKVYNLGASHHCHQVMFVLAVLKLNSTWFMHCHTHLCTPSDLHSLMQPTTLWKWTQALKQSFKACCWRDLVWIRLFLLTEKNGWLSSAINPFNSCGFYSQAVALVYPVSCCYPPIFFFLCPLHSSSKIIIQIWWWKLISLNCSKKDEAITFAGVIGIGGWNKNVENLVKIGQIGIYFVCLRKALNM